MKTRAKKIVFELIKIGFSASLIAYFITSGKLDLDALARLATWDSVVVGLLLVEAACFFVRTVAHSRVGPKSQT